MDEQSGSRAGEDLCQRPGDLPDAIACASDELALGLMTSLRARGVVARALARAPVLDGSAGGAARPPQQVRTRQLEELVAVERRAVEHLVPRLRSVCHRDRDGAVQLDDRGRL